MDKINFTDATLSKRAYVTINGNNYNVNDATYSGGTDLNASTFNTMQTNIENAINGIVESGSNSNGTYIKYADGTMICHKRIVGVTIAITNSWAGMYEGNYAVGDFPATFVSAPTVTGTSFGSGLFIEQMCYGTSTTSWGTITVAHPNKVTHTNCCFGLIAIGRWK